MKWMFEINSLNSLNSFWVNFELVSDLNCINIQHNVTEVIFLKA